MKLLGSILKWTGGITAVISLMIGSASVYELYTSWNQRKDAVAELIAASEIQLASQDYEGGWLLLRQALKLEPASKAVRRFEIPFAMAWLRNVRVTGGQSFADVVDPLLPVLYRGVTDTRKSVAADVYAHIAWANYLKRRSGNQVVEIDGHFRKALELDSANLYANLYWGHWTLNPMNRTDYGEADIVKARRHFDAALKSGKDTTFVVNVMLAALLASNDDAAVRETLGVLSHLRKADIPIPAGILPKIAKIFEPIAARDRIYGEAKLVEITGYLSPSELRQIFELTVGQLPTKRGWVGTSRRYISGRLAEAEGDLAAALSAYRSLAADESTGKAYIDQVVRPAIDRASVVPQ